MNNLPDLIKSRNAVAIAQFIKDNNLDISDGKIQAVDSQSRQRCKELHQFYDRSQIIKKILLNS